MKKWSLHGPLRRDQSCVQYSPGALAKSKCLAIQALHFTLECFPCGFICFAHKARGASGEVHVSICLNLMHNRSESSYVPESC